MKALGGDVRVESAPGKGTRVVAYCSRSEVDKSDGSAVPGSADAQGLAHTPGVHNI